MPCSPNAAITFDKLHAVKIINDAVDQVRRTERKDHKLLAGTRYLWLRNPDRLSERQRAIVESLSMRHLKTARAYRIRLALLHRGGSGPPQAMVFLGNPLSATPGAVTRHSDGISRWFQSRIANGRIEGINSLIKPPRPRLAAVAQFETSPR